MTTASPHDSDDDPMVYETPRDYASWARQHRQELLASGTKPEDVILESEVRDHVPLREGESDIEYTQRYVETMNGMIQRGVMILNDQCTADVVAHGFGFKDGRRFDLGPGSGVTKGMFRDFGQWFDERVDVGGEAGVVPERFRRFEVVGDRRGEAEAEAFKE
jgi:hypothetical protein